MVRRAHSSCAPNSIDGPTKAFLSVRVDLRKLSCLYVWTYDSFPVFMGGPTIDFQDFGWTYPVFPVFKAGADKAFRSAWMDLRKIFCLFRRTNESFPVSTGGPEKSFLSFCVDL